MNSLEPQYDNWNVYLVVWECLWNSAWSQFFYFQFPIDCQ